MKESSKTLIAAAFLLFTTCVSTSNAQPFGFEIRLVHPQNDSLLDAKELPGSLDLNSYDKFEQEAPNWPTVVWASRAVRLGTCDLKEASLKTLWDEVENEKRNQIASPEVESILRLPQIELKFNASGTQKLERLTAGHINERMAIILDGKLLAAPTIIEPIAGGTARLTTSWSLQKAQDVTKRINCLISKCQRK